jgi:hypothetical protein
MEFAAWDVDMAPTCAAVTLCGLLTEAIWFVAFVAVAALPEHEDAVVAVAALPVHEEEDPANVAVIVPALKFPDASRRTIMFAELVLTAPCSAPVAAAMWFVAFVAVAAFPEHEEAVVAVAALPVQVSAVVAVVAVVAVAAFPEQEDATVAVAAFPVQDPELPEMLPEGVT